MATYSNSKLATYVRTAHQHGYYGLKTKPITKITIHHTAGVVSVEQLGAMFADPNRWACSNYGIGNDGRIGLYCMEAYAAGTSDSYDNDNQAVTIEVSNSMYGGNWPVSAKAYESLIKLCVDICSRNGIKKLNWTGDERGNLTVHRLFRATACPGDYLMSKMPDIAKEVNKRLEALEYDVNGDGVVNLVDATTLQKVVAKWKGIKYDRKKADVNHDGKINLADVTALMKYIAKGCK